MARCTASPTCTSHGPRIARASATRPATRCTKWRDPTTPPPSPPPPPLAGAPDGAFLTIGYGRPFPVNDASEPPAAAPASLVDIAIQVGPLPPFDLDAELERILRHQ